MLLSHSVYKSTWWHCKLKCCCLTLSIHDGIVSLQCCCLTLSINVHEDIASLQCCCLTLPMYIVTMCVYSVAVSLYLHQDNTIHVCFQCCCLTLSTYIMSTWISNVAILHHFWQRSRPLSSTRTVEFKGCIHVQYSENWLLKMQVKPQTKQLFTIHGLAANLWIPLSLN